MCVPTENASMFRLTVSTIGENDSHISSWPGSTKLMAALVNNNLLLD